MKKHHTSNDLNNNNLSSAGKREASDNKTQVDKNETCLSKLVMRFDNGNKSHDKNTTTISEHKSPINDCDNHKQQQQISKLNQLINEIRFDANNGNHNLNNNNNNNKSHNNDVKKDNFKAKKDNKHTLSPSFDMSYESYINSSSKIDRLNKTTKQVNNFEIPNRRMEDDSAANSNLILNSIIGSIRSEFEKTTNEVSLIKAVSNMPNRFKDAFEGIVKVNRIFDYNESQNFGKIQETYSIENRFSDSEFLPCDESIHFTRKLRSGLIMANKASHSGPIRWVRAKDLVPDAQFALDDDTGHAFSPFIVNEKNYKKFFHTTDLDQGCLGNCWFISAATGIIQNFPLFKRVVPFDNSFDDKFYTGAFHFRFWIFGTWKDVVIDDYLPVADDGSLIFCRNRDNPNEFWCALLEKAYAKVCGSYEALEGGFISEALIDMSGGIEESYNLVKIRTSTTEPSTGTANINNESFWDLLINARKKSSVIGCNIELEDPSKQDEKLTNGLVRGHAYIITKAAELTIDDKVHRLLRIYNPWGNEVEWNGEWSDRSSIWRSIDEQTKEKLELKLENDGEFWMSYEDWLQNFDNCQICNLSPDTINDINENDWENARLLSNMFSMWQCQMFHGEWIKDVSAGGSGQKNEDLYWTNPQFTFAINETDIIKDEKCWVIIGLIQKNTRQKRMKLEVDSAEQFIQFRIFKIRNQKVFTDKLSKGEQFNWRDVQRIDSSGAYRNNREVSARFALKTGIYLIVPSCYDENVEGEFLLRIFTEKPLNKNDCKSLSCKKRIHQHKHDPVTDPDTLNKEIETLSTGAADAFHKFVHLANDFSKQAANNRIMPRGETIESIESSSSEDEDGEKDASNTARPAFKPQISCSQM